MKIRSLLCLFPAIGLYGCAGVKNLLNPSAPMPEFDAASAFKGSYDSGSIEEQVSGWGWSEKPVVFRDAQGGRLQINYKPGATLTSSNPFSFHNIFYALFEPSSYTENRRLTATLLDREG